MLISIQNMFKTYNMGDTAVHALDGISLSIEAGEFVAVMGASGSGKSTLPNILGCLDTPTSGSYFLDDIEVSRMSRAQRARVRNEKLGFVFQNFNLLSRTNALENVELPTYYNGKLSAKQRHRRASDLLERVGLGNRHGHTPAQLSGGQQQRVAIARALMNNPPVILADEPRQHRHPFQRRDHGPVHAAQPRRNHHLDGDARRGDRRIRRAPHRHARRKNRHMSCLRTHAKTARPFWPKASVSAVGPVCGKSCMTADVVDSPLPTHYIWH